MARARARAPTASPAPTAGRRQPEDRTEPAVRRRCAAAKGRPGTHPGRVRAQPAAPTEHAPAPVQAPRARTARARPVRLAEAEARTAEARTAEAAAAARPTCPAPPPKAEAEAQPPPPPRQTPRARPDSPRPTPSRIGRRGCRPRCSPRRPLRSRRTACATSRPRGRRASPPAGSCPHCPPHGPYENGSSGKSGHQKRSAGRPHPPREGRPADRSGRDQRTAYASFTVWMTELPLASVSSVFRVTGLPAAPVWFTVAVQWPPCCAVVARVQVSPPSYE